MWHLGDDLITSSENEVLFNRRSYTLKSACFALWKWASKRNNSDSTSDAIKVLEVGENGTKTLGAQWLSHADIYSFKVQNVFAYCSISRKNYIYILKNISEAYYMYYI